MIQIIVCQCTKQKFSEAAVGFYTEQKFYPQIKEVFVAPCLRHLMFKDRFRTVQVDTTCKFLLLERGCCNNYKTKSFNLNFIADKIRVLPETVPSTVEIKTIEEYLERDIKSTLFFHFYKNFIKVVCSLENPAEMNLLKVKMCGQIDFGLFYCRL